MSLSRLVRGTRASRRASMKTRHDHESRTRRDVVDSRRLASPNGSASGNGAADNGDLPAAAPSDPLLAESAGREAVLAIGQAGLEGLPLAELTQRAVGLIVEQLALDFCQLWELLPSGQEFLLRAGSCWAATAVGSMRLAVDAADQPGFTLEAPAPVVITDFECEQRFRPPRYLAERGVRSGLSVRIPGPRPGFGVISGHTIEPRQFSPHSRACLAHIDVRDDAVGSREINVFKHAKSPFLLVKRMF